MHRPRQRKLRASLRNRTPRRHRNPARKLLTSNRSIKELFHGAICPAESGECHWRRCAIERKKPQARPGDEMRAWGSGRRRPSPPPHSMFRRDRSGRDAVGGGLGPANAALAAAECPQVGKAAGPWRRAGEMHRASAVRARRPDDAGIADRPLQLLQRQHRNSYHTFQTNE